MLKTAMMKADVDHAWWPKKQEMRENYHELFKCMKIQSNEGN